jgi:hypothetical protein
VNLATVVFAKSTYPASGEEVMQFSVDSKNAAKSGLWYVRKLPFPRLTQAAWKAWAVKM